MDENEIREEPEVLEQETAQEQPLEDKEKQQQQKYETFLTIYDLVRMFAVITILFVFFFRLVAVDGSSMYPTLVDRDYLILESNFLYRDVKQGDIVVLNTPYYVEELNKGLIVKRVIATGGQTVDIDFEQGLVYVDGQLLDEPYINEPTYEDFAQWGESLIYPVTVPEGSIFVMGDNRNESSDSRFAKLGCIDESCILGKVLLVAVPGKQTDMYGKTIGGRTWQRFGTVS